MSTNNNETIIDVRIDDVIAYVINNEDKKMFQHPWKLSREQCIINILKNQNINNIADIGVNDMYYTNKMKEFAKEKIYAVDIFFPEDGMIKNDIICINDISKLPNNTIDCIIMMDVLEHIEDDVTFYKSVVDKLKKDGMLLITVPAWQFLFSAHDTKSNHYRRYNRSQLINLMTHKDIKIEKCHFFYASLFLFRLFFLWKKNKFTGNKSGWKYDEKHILTRIIKTIFNIDFYINKFLAKIDIIIPGLSLLAVCKKV